MDHQRFDDLTRSLTVGLPRRRVLRALAGGALGALLARRGADEVAAARCARVGQPCAAAEACCTGRCKRGACVCPRGQKACGPRCCAAGQICAGNRCCTPDKAAACAGKTCGEATNNCGQIVTCGACPAGQTCQNGQCACVPNCAGKRCGDDGCGGQCGTWPPDLQCRANECVCVPHPIEFTCRGKTCGSPTNNCGQSVTCGTCSGGKSCYNGNCRCPIGKIDCGGTCQECCTNRDCGIGTCVEGRCNAEPIFAEKPEERVGTGKRMNTNATFFRNGLLVAQTNTANIDCCSGLRGRVLIVVRDGGGNAIWVSDLIQCPTRCAAFDPSCAHEGVSSFQQQFPNHPTAGPVIGKWATALDIFQSDGESPITFRDRWMQNIKNGLGIAEEIRDLAKDYL